MITTETPVAPESLGTTDGPAAPTPPLRGGRRVAANREFRGPGKHKPKVDEMLAAGEWVPEFLLVQSAGALIDYRRAAEAYTTRRRAYYRNKYPEMTREDIATKAHADYQSGDGPDKWGRRHIIVNEILIRGKRYESCLIPDGKHAGKRAWRLRQAYVGIPIPAGADAPAALAAADEPITLANLLPPLPPEEYEALKANIQENGFRQAVTVDEHGTIIDGYQRARVAAELGIDYPTTVREGMTEEEKLGWSLSVNLLRRSPTRAQRTAVIRRLSSQLHWSNRRIALVCGVDQATVLRTLAKITPPPAAPAAIAAGAAPETPESAPEPQPERKVIDRDGNEQTVHKNRRREIAGWEMDEMLAAYDAAPANGRRPAARKVAQRLGISQKAADRALAATLKTRRGGSPVADPAPSLPEPGPEILITDGPPTDPDPAHPPDDPGAPETPVAAAAPNDPPLTPEPVEPPHLVCPNCGHHVLLP